MTADEITSLIRVGKIRKRPPLDIAAELAAEDFSKANEFGTFPIHSIAAACFPLIDFAAARGADVNVKNAEGYTALDIAVSRDDVTNVEALLRNGARVDTADRLGNNPLLSAVISCPFNSNIPALLLEAGADLDQPNINNATARKVILETKHPLAATL